jgi:hypothetical protein
MVGEGKKSVSDYACEKRVRGIFERGVKRFNDLDLWIQFLEYSKSRPSKKFTSKLFGE